MSKFLFIGLLVVHGAIHVMGFVKSRDPAALPGLLLPVGKAWGVFWLVTAAVLIATAVLQFASVRWWWALAFVAVAFSQIAVIAAWQDAKFGTILNVAIFLGALGGFGAFRFDEKTRAFEQKLEQQVASWVAAPARSAAHSALPAPVERYLRKALRGGAPDVRHAVIEQTGTFNVGQGKENWKPFVATHRLSTEPPGFVWAARVTVAPGLEVLVHDAYVGRRGTVAPSLLGLVSLGETSDEGGEIARGELLRFLAEAPWYPTALRGDRRIIWSPVDERRAQATLRDGGVTATVVFTFGEDDLVESIRSEDRSRLVDGAMVPTPWVGRWDDYEEHAGLLIPTRCEVEWILPEGPWPYFRGRVRDYQVVDSR